MPLSRFGLVLSVLPLALQAQTTTPPCTGLCLQQVGQCSNGQTTSISGTVYAPNGTDPIPNVTVYIPNATVPAFQDGISCPVPGAPPAGSPLVGTFSRFDGTFALGNAPVGQNIPIVIVAGKWRRQMTIPAVTACTANKFDIRFARNQSEGDIPKFALVTGSADQVECVLRKVGIDDAEFSNLGSQGRVQLVKATGGTIPTPMTGPGSVIDGNTAAQPALMGNSAVLNSFDVLMLPCEGGAFNPSADQLANMLSYANGGGRIYASHYSYTWMRPQSTFASVASWRNLSTTLLDGSATVNQDFGSGATLAKWLQLVGASTTLGQIGVSQARSDVNAVNPPTRIWLTLNSSDAPMQFTWDAPVGAQVQCGRVLFNEYHVEGGNSNPNIAFPKECTAGTMTAQEKLLEYSLFDLSNNGGPASITPDSADFGNQALGYTTAPKVFTITNNSVFTGALANVSATGDFLVTGNTCSSVPAGSSCTVSVAFKPTVLGARTGSLSATFAGTSLSTNLTGSGVPAFALSSNALTFGSLDVGASTAQTIAITNQAPGPLDMPSLNVTGDYKLSTTCPTSIPTGATCQLTVTFTPTTTGTRAGSIVATNGSGVTMTGNGVDFVLKTNPTTDTVIAGLSETAMLTASPLAGFNAPVTLTCKTDTPVSTCVVVNGSFTLNADVSTKVTVTTVSQYTLAGYGANTWLSAFLGLASTAGIVFFRRRSPALARVSLACAALWLATATFTGCSGKLPASNGSNYTVPGAYTVSITGTDGFLVHTATYQLTVKAK